MDIKECAKYKIVEEIKRPNSPVAHYVAHQAMLDRQVEMRILKQTVDEDSVTAKRFVREFKILAKLDHPAIVPILDFGWANRRLFYTTAHRSSTSLAELLKKRIAAMSSSEIVKTTIPIAEVLSYMHEQELIHRGLRLQSVRTNDESQVFYIADFAMLRPSASNLTSCGVPLTELIFHSPEARNPDKKVDHRTDQFMLGCLMFSLAANKNLEEENKKIFVSAEAREDLATELEVSGIHKELVQLIGNLTQFEAKDRYKDMKTVIRNLKRIATKLEALETSRAMSATAQMAAHPIEPREAVEAEPTPFEILEKLVNKENFEKLKVKAKPFLPVALIILVLLTLHSLIVLASLELSSPIEHRLAAGAKKMSIVGRVVSIDKKEGRIAIAKGKKRYTCIVPKDFAKDKLMLGDMLLIKGILQPYENDDEKVIKCSECVHMAFNQ